MMKVETGKYYRTAEGEKVGPMTSYPYAVDAFGFDGDDEGRLWKLDGTRRYGDSDGVIVSEWLEPVAVAPATATLEHKFKVGDVVNNGHNDRTVAKLVTMYGHLAVEYTTGGWDPESALTLVSRNEPTPLHVTLSIDLNPSLAPQVGDAVLIKGTLAGITHSHAGTNYNIVFETQNRRVSLHFLEEDFILDDRDCGPDCACADNDKGPVPNTDTAKAFDALGSWLNSLAVSRAE